MRFVHAADLHIDSPLRGLEEYEGAPIERVRLATRAAMQNLIQLCLDEQATFLIIAGDLFDHDWRDFNTALFVARQLQRLEQAGIPVYIILGNHDSHQGMSRKVPWPRNVTLFDHTQPQTVLVPGHDIALHGMSFPRRDVSDNLVPAYPAPRQGMLNVGLLHTNANGSRDHDNYAPCSVEELAAKGYDYWALGHVHTFARLHTQPHIIYAGNTQGRHIREQGEKGCVVVHVSDNGVNRIEFRPTDVLRWFLVTVPLAPEDGIEELVDLARRQLQQVQHKADGRLAAVRLEVRGRCSAHHALTRHVSRQEAAATLRGLAGEFGDDLWVEKIKFRTQPALDLQALRQGQDLVGDLLRALQGTSQKETLLMDLAEQLRPLLNKAGPDLESEGIDLEDPRQLASWLGQAEAILLDHLIEDCP